VTVSSNKAALCDHIGGFQIGKVISYKGNISIKRELEGIPSPTLTRFVMPLSVSVNRKLPDYKYCKCRKFFQKSCAFGREKRPITTATPDVPIYNIGEGQFKTRRHF
jgi:UDP-N-acetylmuramate dehydrogenase